MRKSFILLATLLAFLWAENKDIYAQNARIFGRIIMPAVKKKSSAGRGRLYRDRLSSTNNQQKTADEDRSSYQDVIIAAYPLSFKAKVAPLSKARVIQKDAKFIPNVLPVTPGTQVEFINLDRFFHNVFSVSPGAKFNIGRRPTNDVVYKTISKKGDISLFCDIHSQMSAKIISLDTPYFTTANKNGVYLLDNLPKGTYRIEVFHPNFEKVDEQIELKENDSAEQSYTLSN